MFVVLKYDDEDIATSGSSSPDLETAIALLQRQLAHRRASEIMQQPALPVKSARRPRPFSLSSTSQRSYCGSSDGESMTPSSPTFSSLGLNASVTSIRNSLSAPVDGRQHSTQSSFSSVSSDSQSDTNHSRRSSFDWNSLDTSIAALIEDGARTKSEGALQTEHREAAMQYRMSRQMRKSLRQQKQLALLP